MLTDQLDYVLGVDSHRDRHAIGVLAASGELLAEQELAADAAGYRAALMLAERAAPGRRVWAIEGTGCYGAGLARFLVSQGERVLEVERPTRTGSRGRLKSDPLDAVRAARLLLAGQPLAQPRLGEQRDALRALLTTREGAVAVRRAGLCQLRALLVLLPEPLRGHLRGLTRGQLLSRCASLHPRPERADSGQLLALRALARRIRAADQEAAELERAISRQVQQLAPTLLEQTGIGPITAAQLMISWSHPGRIRSEAAFARLAGAAPIPASSGKTTRHRLDRGGDRQLNRALHTIILARRKHDQQTIAYIKRRQHEGKSLREATRCLKRYLARNLYRHLETMPTTTT
jgi:transposase